MNLKTFCQRMKRAELCLPFSIKSLIFTFFLMAFNLSMQAAIITVTSSADSGPGTLRQAVIDAAFVGDQIEFAVSSGTVTLTNGTIVIDKSLSIVGTGITISGNSSSQIFSIAGGNSVNIRGCIFTNANAGGGFGGAIYSLGDLILDNCTFTNNNAGNGGALANDGNLYMINCRFSGNTAMGQGGACNFFGNSTVINCSFFNNTAGTLGGAFLALTNNHTVINCTIAFNTANDVAGGGGIWNSGGTLTLQNSIVFGNVASSNPDIRNDAALTASHNLIGDFAGSVLIAGIDNNITGTPNFVNAPFGDLTLADGSLGINLGNISLLPVDINDADGDSNTAEIIDFDQLLNPRVVTCAPDLGAFENQNGGFVVTNTNDSGAGSLRNVLDCTNNTAGSQTISFNIPGNGPHTITYLTRYDIIDAGTIIDGSTQPGFVDNPLIFLDGTASAESTSFYIGGENTEIYGLNLQNSSGSGIFISPMGSGSQIGSTAKRNIITNNNDQQIFISEADNCIVQGNIIGINENNVGNTLTALGILCQVNADNTNISFNTIGTASLDGNALIDIRADSENTLISNNLIGTTTDGFSFGAGIGIGIFSGDNANITLNTISNNVVGIVNNAQLVSMVENNFICNETKAIELNGVGNGNLAPPIILTASPTEITGTGIPNISSEIDILLQDDSNCSNTACQGVFVGFTAVNVDGTWTFTPTTPFNAGAVITGIQIANPTGNGFESSELSACATVSDLCNPDNDPPIFSNIPPDLTLECSDFIIIPPSPTAMDVCDGDISNNIVSTSVSTPLGCVNNQKNQDEWIFTVMDAAGNMASVSVIYTYEDTDAPFFINIPPDLTIECSDAIQAPDFPDAIDVCQGGISEMDIQMTTMIVPLNCINNQVREEIFTFDVMDDCGNMAQSVSVTYTYIDTFEPLFNENLPQDVLLNCGDPIPPFETLTATDLCTNHPIANVTFTEIGGFDPSTCVNGQSIVRTWTATDDCGNSTEHTQTITFNNDTNNPVFPTINPSTITVNTTIGSCTAFVQFSAPPATDICGMPMTGVYTNDSPFANDNNSLSIEGNYEIGIYNVTFTATDLCGNQGTTSVSVEISDGEAPVLNGIPADVTISCGDPYPTIPTVTATDNCDSSPSIMALGPPVVNGCNPAPTQIQDVYSWTATDSGGNSISENWTVTIINDLLVDLGDDVSLCDGPVTLDAGISNATYEWSTGEFTETIEAATTGLYSVTVTNANGCCNFDEIMMNPGTPPNATAMGGEIDCANGSVQLMGNSTTAGATYSWNGPGGFTVTDQNPTVSVVGDYILTVTAPNGCTNTATATVTANSSIPNVSATGGTIDCNNTSIFLDGNSTTPGVTFEWTDPDGVMSNEEDPEVFVGGTYLLTVTAINGCTASANAEVIENLTVPSNVSATGGTIDCINNSIQLMGNSDDASDTYSWTGPNGFTSFDQNPTVSVAGTYTLTVTNLNGCITTVSTDVINNSTVPNASAIGGTLTCTNQNIALAGNSTTTGVTYAWTGPNGFTSGIQNPIVSVAGTYILTVTSTNGCTASATAEVIDNGGAGPVAAFTFVATNLSVAFTDISTGDATSWSWDFSDGGNTSQMQNPNYTFSAAGTYEVCLTATNVCGTNQSCQMITVSEVAAGDFKFIIGTATGFSGTIVNVPVIVEGFEDIIAFQKSIHIADPMKAKFIGTDNYNLTDLDAPDFSIVNDGTDGNMTAVWFTNSPVTLADGAKIYDLQIELLSTVDECVTIFIDGVPTPIVVGQFQNGTINNILHTEEDGEACVLARVDISGNIALENGDPLDDVTVTCTGQPDVLTDVNGNYEFFDLEAGIDYTVIPSRVENPLDGVNAIDLALIFQHILGTSQLSSSYKVVAADVDTSGLVNGADLLIIQQLIQTVITEYPDFNAWRFVDEKYIFADIPGAANESFAENIFFPLLDRDTIGNDFVAVKLGDVDESSMGLQPPLTGDLNFELSETPSEEFTMIHFHANDFTDILAYQFDVIFNQENMQFLEVVPGNLPGITPDKFGQKWLMNGVLTAVWYDQTGNIEGTTINEGEILFSLKFQNNVSGIALADRIQLGSSALNANGFTKDKEALIISTTYANEITPTTDLALNTIRLYDAQPNPFREKTTLNFDLPSAQSVQITIFDAVGEVVKNIEQNLPKGFHQVVIDGRELNGNGVYYYTFQVADFYEIKKLILQE